MRDLRKLAVAGLGALALSCSGVHVRDMSDIKGIAQAANTLTDSNQDNAECVKLNAPPSEEEEYTLGGSIALNWVSRGGGLLPLDPNKSLVRYLNVVGKNLGAQSSRPLLRWTFGVLQTDESFNALSAPGGYIFVTHGLLRGVENEAQLAGVLAHEIAHVTSRHVLNRYTETKVSECRRAASLSRAQKASQQAGLYVNLSWAEELVSLARHGGGPLDLGQHPGLLAGLTDSVVDKLVNGGLDERDEFAADAEAVRLMVSAGYEPREYIRFLARLPSGRNILSHHPSKQERTKRLATLLDSNQSSQGFSEFSPGTEGLVQPPLPPEFASLKKTATQDKP